MIRMFSMLGALAAAAMSTPATYVFSGAMHELPSERPARRAKAAKLHRSLPKRRRSKAAAGRPNKHRNRIHVSRRTKRKHRRGKAA